MFLNPRGRPSDFERRAFKPVPHDSMLQRALPCSLFHGYELEYSPNDNIYLDCIYSTVAEPARNSNKVSQRNILTADDVHMLAWLNAEA